MAIVTGEELAWRLFMGLDPEATRERALASFDPVSRVYSVKSFGREIFISLREKKIFGESPLADFLLNKTGHFFDLALLWYLITAKDISPTDMLVKPSSVKGGDIFLKGTHVLPLDRVARKFGDDPKAFLKKGELLGGEKLSHGDAAIRLYPFPRVPVTIILWAGDEEFPARADLFFDSTCDAYLPTDVLWSMATVSVLAMAE